MVRCGRVIFISKNSREVFNIASKVKEVSHRIWVLCRRLHCFIPAKMIIFGLSGRRWTKGLPIYETQAQWKSWDWFQWRCPGSGAAGGSRKWWGQTIEWQEPEGRRQSIGVTSGLRIICATLLIKQCLGCAEDEVSGPSYWQAFNSKSAEKRIGNR